MAKKYIVTVKEVVDVVNLATDKKLIIKNLKFWFKTSKPERKYKSQPKEMVHHVKNEIEEVLEEYAVKRYINKDHTKNKWCIYGTPVKDIAKSISAIPCPKCKELKTKIDNQVIYTQQQMTMYEDVIDGLKVEVERLKININK